ncbi:MAG: sulfatase-like hydrolase/transferase [Rubripirellula sp.]
MRRHIPTRLLLLLIGVLGCTDQTSRLPAAERPNIVMIISDDQTFSDLGFMGNSVVQTPNLDALARRSARFTHGYVPSSVCRPSLVTLLTGLYPHQHGVYFNHPPPGFSGLTKSPTIDRKEFERLRHRATKFVRDVPTLPRILAENGYRCLQTGKYWEGHYRNAGFTDGMTTARPTPGATYGNKALANGQQVAHGNGDAGLAIGRETMKPIRDFLASIDDQPFFIWYAPFLPHLPHNSPEHFENLYPKNLSPHLRKYYAACSQFDQTVGTLMENVEAASKRDTVYVFVIDNGFTPDPDQPMRDGHGFNYTSRSKRSPFEQGLRTPILIAWDGHVVPVTCTSLCSSVDIMPTLLEAVEIDAPASLPGRSLLSVATAQKTELDPEPVFGAIYPGDASVLDNPSADVAYRWVRDQNFKLIVPHSTKSSKQGKDPGKRPWGDYLSPKPHLFDLSADPNEQHNLAQQENHAKVLADLTQKLNDWWTPNPR